MNAFEMTDKWHDKTLSVNDINEYLKKNIAPLGPPIDSTELAHLTFCCHSMYRWATGQQGGLGGFLTAVRKNDLMAAAGHADGINRKHLWVYPLFLYNVAPQGWDKKGEDNGQDVG
jgi:hypothetical protein